MGKFWRIYQNEGNRTNYEGGFSGEGWTDETFLPQYNIKVTDAYNMFYNSQIKDAYEYVKNIDFSNCTRLTGAFKQSHFKHLGIINCENVSTLKEAFSLAEELETIDKIILKSTSNSTAFTDAFKNMRAIKNIEFEGVISKDLELGGTYNKKPWGENLSKNSISNIINCLEANGAGTLELSRAAVVNAFGEDLEEENGEWDKLCSARPGWTISLI